MEKKGLGAFTQTSFSDVPTRRVWIKSSKENTDMTPERNRTYLAAETTLSGKYPTEINMAAARTSPAAAHKMLSCFRLMSASSLPRSDRKGLVGVFLKGPQILSVCLSLKHVQKKLSL